MFSKHIEMAFMICEHILSIRITNVHSIHIICPCYVPLVCINNIPHCLISDYSHGMSYSISGLVKNFKSKDYDDDHPIVVSTHL